VGGAAPRGRAAARLHIRIVALFSIVAVVPAILMAIVASVTLNRGLDHWFSERTRAIVDTSLSIAQAYAEEHARTLKVDILGLKSDFERAQALLARDPDQFQNFMNSVAALRDAMGEEDFASAWAEGAALSTQEAIAYAQRGWGERKRSGRGWASLTPAELDVVRLAREGLGNKDIATRLFISPRTVQAHLTHVYTKLGLTSRVQLAQEAARHA